MKNNRLRNTCQLPAEAWADAEEWAYPPPPYPPPPLKTYKVFNTDTLRIINFNKDLSVDLNDIIYDDYAS